MIYDRKMFVNKMMICLYVFIIIHRLIVAYGCPHCCNVAFCSMKCQAEACSTYHRYECEFVDLLIGEVVKHLFVKHLWHIPDDGLLKLPNCDMIKF